MRLLFIECDQLREIITDLWVDLIKDIAFLSKMSVSCDQIDLFIYIRDKVNKETEKSLKYITFQEVTNESSEMPASQVNVEMDDIIFQDNISED